MGSISTISVSVGSTPATLRTAEDADGPKVLALLKQAALESEFLVRYFDEVTTSYEAQSALLSRKLAAPHDLFLVVELADQVIGIGFLNGSPLRRFAHEVTLAIAVLRDYWGKGVGSALMRAMLDWADSRGIVRVSLEVVETNARAIQLYESFGFEYEGRLRARRRHGDIYLDNHLMARVMLPV